MGKKLSRFKKIKNEAKALLDERTLESKSRTSKLYRVAHFCVLVWTSFTRNRLPVRASALAYATLLSLIPMLAVIVSITSTFLKKEGEEQIDHFVVKLVANLTPPATLTTNEVAVASEPPATNAVQSAEASPKPNLLPDPNPDHAPLGDGALTNNSALAAFAHDEKAVAARKEIVRKIHEFIQNTQSGALGVTGSVLLIFAAISMLGRVETTFNDIWGIEHGRSWFTRVVLYWGVLTLAPTLLIVALGLATGPHLAATRNFLNTMPFVSNLVFQFLPIVVLCLTFAFFYQLMPNTKVKFSAALVGGIVSAMLFHLNSMVSVLYVSRVVSNSKIYGSLGLIPVFMIGLYCSWLILLLGAQVAYAFQNRNSYLEERQVETVNQRGREFVALRLMTFIGQRFVQAQSPPGPVELAEELGVPTRLITEITQTLANSKLLVETSGSEPGYLPARPIEGVTCHDILLAMRATAGQDLATRDEPSRARVYGEFLRIEEAERQVASSVTLLALVNRAQTQRNELPMPQTEFSD
jgi:membrane protein